MEIAFVRWQSTLPSNRICRGLFCETFQPWGQQNCQVSCNQIDSNPSNMEELRPSSLNENPFFCHGSQIFESHCFSSNILKYTDWSRWNLTLVRSPHNNIAEQSQIAMFHKFMLLSNFCTRPKSSPPDLAVSHFFRKATKTIYNIASEVHDTIHTSIHSVESPGVL